MKNIKKRVLHSSSYFNDKDNLVIPLIVYNNVETEKVSILKDNKGKSGIYR
jgi:hypothetical protein